MKRIRIWEWEATRTDEYGDIQWSEQSETLADLAQGDPADGSFSIGLVFSRYEQDGDDEPEMIERSWADVSFGSLADQTNEQVTVPSRFHKELKQRHTLTN
jgi:outer membrane scaffolding protein for murein synthesis (MipA/OmpV family)